MDSKKYIGMDVHKESISMAVMNGAGKIVMECVIETKANMILQFFDGLRRLTTSVRPTKTVGSAGGMRFAGPRARTMRRGKPTTFFGTTYVRVAAGDERRGHPHRKQAAAARDAAGHDALRAPRGESPARGGREVGKCTRSVTARGGSAGHNSLSRFFCWCRRRESNPHALAGNGF